MTVTNNGRHISRRERLITWVPIRAVYTTMSKAAHPRIRPKRGGDNTRAITRVKMTRPANSTWMPTCIPTSIATARPR